MFDALVLQWRCPLITLRYTLYHTDKASPGSVLFRTEIKEAQFRSAQNAVLLKCLNDLNDIREWVLSLHFGSLTDFVQEMGQWSLMLR